MKTLSVLFIFYAALLTGGCSHPAATGTDDRSVRLQSDSYTLQRAAEQALRGSGVSIADSHSDLPLLLLNEESSYAPGTIAATGSISDYQVSYALTYRLADKPAQTIRYEEVVDYNDNVYRGSLKQQKNIVASLRRTALIDMLIKLQLR